MVRGIRVFVSYCVAWGLSCSDSYFEGRGGCVLAVLRLVSLRLFLRSETARRDFLSACLRPTTASLLLSEASNRLTEPIRRPGDWTSAEHRAADGFVSGGGPGNQGPQREQGGGPDGPLY
ncbi:hypothetical protein INR49_020693 [Caranx melampygus]|nr:hypothetical protein INR49_020693 [Caranx melampygus]